MEVARDAQRGPGLPAHDHGHGGDDEPGAGDRRGADGLAEEQRAEDDGDERVDVGVGRDQREPCVVQQPHIGRVGDHRSEDHEVGKREPRSRRDGA